jgi:virulence factor
MSKDHPRLAMIGAGKMANLVHYPSLASFPDATIAAIADLNPKALNDTADKYRVEKRYTDFRRMLDETAPDGVYAIGPVTVMFPIWVEVLQRGLPLFIEKPMGVSLHQAHVLTALAAKHKCITQVGHQRRSAPLAVMLRKRCLERGPITHAVAEFYKGSPSPSLDPVEQILNNGTHAVDTVRWMCSGDSGGSGGSGEVTKVDAECRRIGTPDINFFAATLRFDTGAVGTVLFNMAGGGRVFRTQMFAPGIRAEADVEDKGLLADGKSTETFDTKTVAGSDQFHVYAGFAAKSREFIDAIKAGKELTSSPFSDAVKTMEVCERIRAAAME